MKPGDRIKVMRIDGTEYEDTVHSVRYRSAEPEILQHPTGWRRILRQLTPARWRKPLPIAQPYRPEEFEVICVSEVGRRAARAAGDIRRTVDRLLGPQNAG